MATLYYLNCIIALKQAVGLHNNMKKASEMIAQVHKRTTFISHGEASYYTVLLLNKLTSIHAPRNMWLLFFRGTTMHMTVGV